MITGEYEQLQDMARGNTCAACGTRLVVAWHKEQSCYYLKCGCPEGAKSLKRELSLTEEHKAGVELPEPIKGHVEKGMARRQAKGATAPLAETFSGIPATDLGSGELLLPDVLQFLSGYARKYGLDPARGHVCMMYGKPYVTLDGYLYHAHEVNHPYRMASRPMDDNMKLQYMVPLGDHAWLCEITKTLSGSYFTGIGIVTREEMTAMSKKNPQQLASPVVAKHPWQLAQKRSEWQALRRAFPIGESEELQGEAGDQG